MTTIEISESLKDDLRDERLEHETNYEQTIQRLLGQSDTPFLTEPQVREVVRNELQSHTQ